MNRVARLVLRYPWHIVLFFFALLAGALLIHAKLVRYDVSLERQVPVGAPEYRTYEEFRQLFEGEPYTYLVALRDHALFSPEDLRLIDRLTRRIEKLEGTASVLSLTNVLDMRAAPDGSLEVVPFVEGVPEDPAVLKRLRADAIEHPLLVNNLISRDGETTALIVRLRGDMAQLSKGLPYFDKVEDILEDEGRGRYEFHVSGGPYLSRVLVKHMFHDLWHIGPLVFLINGGLLFLVFRRVRAVWAPLLATAPPAIFTLAIMDLCGVPLWYLTSESTLAVLIMVIALSDAVHLLSRYEEEIRASPLAERSEAVDSTIVHIGTACLMTSVTTAAGLFSLASAGLPGIREFGLFAGVGILVAYVVGIMVLPAGIVLVDGWMPARPRPRVRDGLDRTLHGISKFVGRYSRPIVGAGMLLLCASCIVALGGVEIAQRYTLELKKDDPALRSLSFIEENLTGVFGSEILIQTDRPGSLKDPSLLRDIDYLGAELEAMPQVSRVIAPVDFVKRINQVLHEGKKSDYAIPDSREAVAQYLLLLEQAGGDDELSRLVSYDYSAAHMTVRTKDTTAEERRQVSRRIREVVESRFDRSVRVNETGAAPLWSLIAGKVVSSLLRSLFVAMPIIFAVIFLALRSARLSVLSVLPNVLPLLVGLAFAGATGISLRISTLIAFPMALGIAVDDTIHFLFRYRSEAEAGVSPEAAVGRTLRSTGRAMVLTTVFLVGGFSVLLASEFQAVIDLTAIICVVLVTALLADLLLLPALVLRFGPG